MLVKCYMTGDYSALSKMILYMKCKSQRIFDFYTPPHKKWWDIVLYPLNFECPSVFRPSVHLSVRLSISASCPCSNFSTFLSIFFRLCIDIGIREEWFGIASGIISFRNNRVMALDLCPKCIFGQYLKKE